MKKILLSLVFISMVIFVSGQNNITELDGTVTYVTSQNVYVSFKSTDNIKAGDTLFINKGDQVVPALVVNNLSSISAVCTPISSMQFKVNDKILSRQKARVEKPATKEAEGKITAPVKVETPVTGETKTGNRKSAGNARSGKNTLNQKGKGNSSSSPGGGSAQEMGMNQQIKGKLSVSSYTNFSNTPGGSSERMRYTFSLDAKNIANTRLSGETYFTFTHKDGEWSKVQEDIFNGLKIYNLALRYLFSYNFSLLVGRKINPRLTNMGAIDGMQFEMRFGSFTAGLLAGSRPDYKDYGFNFNLFQYGAYVSHDFSANKRSMQSTIAFAEQKNNGKTDRRFIYIQHSNALVKNLNFFGTAEFNLYGYDTVSETFGSTFNLSNLYLSLRYRVIRQLSLSFSYSARQNIIYYETYKNILDQIIDNETLQGYNLQIISNPIRYLSVGARGGYRFRKSDPIPSRNLYGYVTYSRIPFIKVSATVSFTWLKTSYISGKIYSASLSRDLVKGKLYACLGYKHVIYDYYSGNLIIPQDLAEVNLNWIIYKKLSFSINYEGTFEKINNYNRIYINLTQRF